MLFNMGAREPLSMRLCAATVRNMQDYLTLSAAEMGRGIEAGQIDAVELTEAHLEAIGAHEFADRIYARLTTDRARAEAIAAAERAKNGTRRSPLDGVPISWKDLYDTAGVATESGTKMLEGRVPSEDAAVLKQATFAGTVCLGKTQQTELAFSGLGVNPNTASPPCVNDHGAASGGSSSGAAASVAYGLAAVGIGSDTGGSVRIPAFWNDLVGLKTVSGRLPLTGVVPLCARFDTVGPLCRSVEDAGLMLAAMEGKTAADLSSASLQDVRLGILQTTAFENMTDVPGNAFDEACKKLASKGAVLSNIDLPIVAEATTLGPILFPAEAYGTWRNKIETEGHLMYPPVRERFLQGKTILAADFVAAWQRLDQLRAEYVAATAGFDAVIVPSCPILPPKIEELMADADYFAQQNLFALQNTRIANLMGLAAITLPTGVPSTGIIFQGTNEEHLLRLAAAAEAALS
ncbi:MAG: amidase family protein [Paracoccaceae bacterium]